MTTLPTVEAVPPLRLLMPGPVHRIELRLNSVPTDLLTEVNPQPGVRVKSVQKSRAAFQHLVQVGVPNYKVSTRTLDQLLRSTGRNLILLGRMEEAKHKPERIRPVVQLVYADAGKPLSEPEHNLANRLLETNWGSCGVLYDPSNPRLYIALGNPALTAPAPELVLEF